MSERAPDVPEQVVQFAPKEKSPPNEGDALDQFGQAIIALLEQAANFSKQQCERALDMAHKLGMQLRAAEGRIDQLQAEIKQCQDRAERAEKWLTRIYQEIEEKLIRLRQ
jgi:chromosome segregation ATPase